MRYRVLLYRRGAVRNGAIGSVEFERLLVTSKADYRCLPEGILTHEQVLELSAFLRHLPPIGEGAIGDYDWIEAGQ